MMNFRTRDEPKNEELGNEIEFVGISNVIGKDQIRFIIFYEFGHVVDCLDAIFSNNMEQQVCKNISRSDLCITELGVGDYVDEYGDTWVNVLLITPTHFSHKKPLFHEFLFAFRETDNIDLKDYITVKLMHKTKTDLNVTEWQDLVERTFIQIIQVGKKIEGYW